MSERAIGARRQTLVMLPVVAIVGALVGATIGRSGGTPIVAAMAWFAGALCVGSYLSAILESSIISAFNLDPDQTASDVIAVASDIVVGGLAGFFLSIVASVDALNAVGAASSILFLQTVIIDKVVIKNVVGNTLVAILSGSSSVPPDFSHAQSLAARGDLRPARSSYEDAIRAHPKDVRAYIGLARMLRLQARDYPGTCYALQRALDRADMSAAQRQILTRELDEVKKMIVKEEQA